MLSFGSSYYIGIFIRIHEEQGVRFNCGIPICDSILYIDALQHERVSQIEIVVQSMLFSQWSEFDCDTSIQKIVCYGMRYARLSKVQRREDYTVAHPSLYYLSLYVSLSFFFFFWRVGIFL